MKKAGDFSQIILYAKGWFERKDLFEDLKVLVGEAFMLSPEHVDKSTVRGAMMTVAKEFDLIQPDGFVKFFDDCSPESYWRYSYNVSPAVVGQPHPEYDFDTAVVRTVLNRLLELHIGYGQGQKILLRKPDFDLLDRNPMSDEDLSKYQWDE